MRLWAVENADILARILEVDGATVAFFSRYHEQHKFDKNTAKERGTAAYSLALALSFMRTGEDSEAPRDRFQRNLHMIFTRKPCFNCCVFFKALARVIRSLLSIPLPSISTIHRSITGCAAALQRVTSAASRSKLYCR